MQKTALIFTATMAAILVMAPTQAQAPAALKPQIHKTVQSLPPKLKEAKAQLDSGQPETTTNLRSLLNSKTPLKLEQYLALMRPAIHRYNQVMLSLIANDGIATEALPQGSQISAAEIAKLEELLTQVNPPADIAEQHACLIAALKPTIDFVKAGGCAKQGFHLALECAKQMGKTSDAYHDCVLSAIGDHGLTAGSDPFIVISTAEKQHHPAGTKAKSDRDKKAPNISDIQRGTFGGPDLVGTNGATYEKSHNTPARINDIDGALGMSGMFNGLGGTGTNGLVDGLGFSSGLNGFVNGAGSSSGMSGMMNDTESKTSR